MYKTTLKEIKNMVKIGSAIDISDYKFNEIKKIIKNNNIKKICYSIGIYGINGGVIQADDGTLYAITRGCSALLMIF